MAATRHPQTDENRRSKDMDIIEIEDSTMDMQTTNLPPAVDLRGVDAAFAAMQDGQFIDIGESTNRRIVRKIDLYILPILCAVYAMNYLDKTALSYASIMGFKEDLHLTGDQYQWLASIFYFGYLIIEYPTARLLQLLPLAKYSGFCIIAWGIALTMTAMVHNFQGGMACRFLLGAFEAAVTPGWALITAQWYTRHEQGLRVGIWFGFNGVGQIVGGLLAFGIADGSERYGLSIAPWKALFIITGLLTIALGVVFVFLVPDNQLGARWLKQTDRKLAVARVRVNQQGIGNRHFKFYQFKEALLDPLTWALAFYALAANIPNGGLTSFFSQLIVSFGYSPKQSLLLGLPAGVVEIIALNVCGWYGDKSGNRLLVSTSGMIIAIIGAILLVALPESANVGRLVGYTLVLAAPAPFVALLSIISSNVAGYTKKTTVAAIYLIFYCAGNIIGPQTFRPKDAPHYIPAIITILVCMGLSLADILFIYWYYRQMNKKKEAVRQQPGYIKQENQEWMDLTDKENTEFVYTL